MTDPVRLSFKKFIRAPRARVYAAWTDPELMKRWLAPGELHAPAAQSDARVGGAFRIEMEGMMRGRPTRGVASGVFEELVPHERIVLTWNWAGDYSPPQTRIIVVLREVDGGTEVHLTQEGFGDEQHRSGYEAGWNSAFTKLSNALGA